MATYLTDSWSTVSGLAAVAYGSPDRYPEVMNQVRQGSVVSFLGPMPPSTIVGQQLTLEEFTNSLQTEYDRGENFTRYVNSQGNSLTDLSRNYYNKVISAFDEIATYESSLTDAIEYAMGDTGIDPQRVSKTLNSAIPDLNLFSQMASISPVNKLDKLPASTRIELDSNVSLERDQNGNKLTTGYLTPSDYFGEIAYPGMGSTGDNLPNTLLESIRSGYKGYATLQPLDDLLRPGIADIVSADDIRDFSGVTRSIAGLGTEDTVRDLTGLGTMSDADLAMYNVDLASIVVDINGYTVYDPLKDSNGDYRDPRSLPDYNAENDDPGNGLPYSSRNRSSTFDS